MWRTDTTISFHLYIELKQKVIYQLYTTQMTQLTRLGSVFKTFSILIHSFCGDKS